MVATRLRRGLTSGFPSLPSPCSFLQNGSADVSKRRKVTAGSNPPQAGAASESDESQGGLHAPPSPKHFDHDAAAVAKGKGRHGTGGKAMEKEPGGTVTSTSEGEEAPACEPPKVDYLDLLSHFCSVLYVSGFDVVP